MIKFVNEYRYSIDDTRQVLKAYYAFYPRIQVSHYAALVLCIVSIGLYINTSLRRFLIFAPILLLIHLYKYLQIYLGTKYDAAKIKEETGSDNPMLRYELDNQLRIYRNGKLFAAVPFEQIAGCKEVGDSLVIFTIVNQTAMFKDGFYLEGGNTALKAYLRENGVTVK